MNVLITFTPPVFPVGFCWPADPQTFVDSLSTWGANWQFNIDVANAFWNTGPKPDANHRVFPWLRQVGDGLDGVWWYSATYGAWIQSHPTPASGAERRLWVDTTGNLETYDGGDTDPAGPASGPMWEVDTNFAARFIVGPGAFSASGTIAVNTGTTGTGVSGEDQHTLTVGEMPAHTHDITPITTKGSDNDAGFTFALDSQNLIADKTTSSSGGGLAHNNLPPMWAAYVIKRTSRIYRKIAP